MKAPVIVSQGAVDLLNSPAFWEALAWMRKELLDVIPQTLPEAVQSREDVYKSLMAAQAVPQYLKDLAAHNDLQDQVDETVEAGHWSNNE